MRYKFPIITDLSQVEAAIKGREEFIVAEREFGYVVNYLVNFETTFPQINTKDPELNKLAQQILNPSARLPRDQAAPPNPRQALGRVLQRRREQLLRRVGRP